MGKKSPFWHLYPLFLLITIVSLFLAVLFFWALFRSHHYRLYARNLRTAARLSQDRVLKAQSSGERNNLRKLSRRIASAVNGRFTVMSTTGRVLSDSAEEAEEMDSQIHYPEVVSALNEGQGKSVRFSETLGKKMMYVAVVIMQNGEAAAVARAASPTSVIDKTMNKLLAELLWVGAVIGALSGGLGMLLIRRISQPVGRMQRAAEEFADGNFNVRVPIPNSSELGGLAATFNEMIEQLDSRIKRITEQRNELEAVLSSMSEGVVAVDSNGHIMSINQAAAKLLDVNEETVRGRPVQETIRNTDLQEFVEKTLAQNGPTESRMFLPETGGQFFRLQGTNLLDSSSKKSGAVIVLNDMTRLHQLENIRRDFVANVSHELKTPVTSIKGFVETLLEGAVEDRDETRRFLEIIGKHTSRLNSIIEDLLSLSRLEEERKTREISFIRTNVRPILQSAVELCQSRAEDKDISVRLNCERDLSAKVNAALLEQAVHNLVDNAIKYSQEKSEIEVTVDGKEQETAISVKDRGCGISEEHLSRIFERFYVVDKARSRNVGGTGLGLAIVKHIAQLHKGRVEVKSTAGQGSTFTIYLPTG